MNLFAFATKYTMDVLAGKKNPSINMHNRKEYRTVQQKAMAKANCHRGPDGSYYCNAPTSIHRSPRMEVRE